MAETEANELHPEFDMGSASILHKNLKSIRNQSYGFGINLTYDIQGEATYPYRTETPMFAASLGKVPLAALFVRDGFDPEQRIELTSSDMREGAGFLDGESMRRKQLRYEDIGHGIPVFRLIEDMLIRSGNTAYKVLARLYADSQGSDASRVDILNSEYRNQGWHKSTVVPVGHAIEIGTTSPKDVIGQLKFLKEFAVDAEDGDLAEVAWDSLRQSADKDNGVRSFTLPTGVILHNKTGSYNGDADDRHVYRHDAGLLILPPTEQGQLPKEVYYAFLMQSQKMGIAQKTRVKILQDRMAGEIARYAGARVPRFLGLRALIS